MKLDVVLPSGVLEAARAADAVARAGIDGVWSTEAGTDPFLDLLLPISRGEISLFGTGLAVAFARSPLVTAEAAWQLHAMSGGRFVLGLGSSVARAHRASLRRGVVSTRAANAGVRPCGSRAVGCLSRR